VTIVEVWYSGTSENQGILEVFVYDSAREYFWSTVAGLLLPARVFAGGVLRRFVSFLAAYDAQTHAGKDYAGAGHASYITGRL
jgi:hypothetical protein